MKRNLLLCVDCQNDFITGSLAVPDAAVKIDNIISYFKENDEHIESVAFTIDWHPFRHSSFVEYGGQWPPHCVMFSYGACVYDKLLQTAYKSNKNVYFYTKGDEQDEDDYSFLHNKNNKTFINWAKQYDNIIICGIASEFCVNETVKDLVKIPHFTNKIKVLLDGVAAIHNHDELLTTIRKNNILIETI